MSEPSAGSWAHLRTNGTAQMVDVSGKAVTSRSASASGRVELSAATVSAIREGRAAKGDVLAVARIAALQAAKATPGLVLLAHPVAITAVTVDLDLQEDGVQIAATVQAVDRTGVEMEALSCVVIAALNIVDMVKGVDRLARITDVQVTAKAGGRSGDWSRS